MPTFTKQKVQHLKGILEKIRTAVYRTIGELSAEVFVSSEPLPFAHRTQGRKIELKPGDVWAAEVFDCGWFHFTGTIPTQAAGADVVLLIDINGEACVVDSDGTPVQGLTNISSEFDKVLGMPGKRVFPFTANARGGETVDLWVDAGANDLFGRMQEKGTFKQATIAIRNPQLFALQFDWEVLHELMSQLPEQSARRQRIWAALSQASDALIDFTENEARKVRAILKPELVKTGGDPSLTISAVGQCPHGSGLALAHPARRSASAPARSPRCCG